MRRQFSTLVLGVALLFGAVVPAFGQGATRIFGTKSDGTPIAIQADANGQLKITLDGGAATLYGLKISDVATPAAPTVTPTGTTGATTYGYKVTATTALGETAASSETTNATGNATLSATNYNKIDWVAVTGATGYKVYRSTGGATQGLVGTITNGSTVTFNDTGIVAGAAAPSTNTTGKLLLANGSAAAPSLAFASDATLGLYNTSGRLGVAVAGTAVARFQGSAASAEFLLVKDTANIYMGAAGDIVLTRLAANSLALRNSTNAQTFTVGPAVGYTQIFGASNIGTTTTAGIVMNNTTAAAAGAQQYSLGLSFIGQGWKTDATAASQPVETRFELRPVQGTSAPTYIFALAGRVNAGAWTDLFYFDGQFKGLINAQATGYFGWSTRTILRAGADGQISINNNAETASVIATSSVTGGAALASHAISLAQDATTKVGTAPVGFFTVVNTTDSEVCTFSLIGTGVVAELSDSGGNCSATKDNAATINVYYFSDGVYVQNKKAATKSVRLVLNGV